MHVHGEDKVGDVWGGEVDASTTGGLVYLIGAHGGCSELIRLNDASSKAIKAGLT